MRARDERGSATVFVIGFAMVLLLCAGLVIDGGLAINKRMRIADDAEQAARIGADSIDVLEFRRSNGVNLVIDRQLAQQRIGNYMSSLGYDHSNFHAEVDRDQVAVFLNDTSKTYILNLVGVDFHPVASAVAVPDTDQNPAQPNGGVAP
jgi:Flp pilus assembly protein TadG